MVNWQETHRQRFLATVPASVVTESRPVHILDSRSLWGAISVLAIAVFFAAGLPLIDDAIPGGNELEPGQPYAFLNGTIVPVEGWSLSDAGGGLFVQLVDGAATLTIVPAVEGEQSASELVDLQVTAFQNDTTTTWVVGDVTPFTSDAGDRGFYVVGHSPTDVLQSWSIDLEGGAVVSFVGQAPDTVWSDVADGMQQMVSSFVYLPGEGQ